MNVQNRLEKFFLWRSRLAFALTLLLTSVGFSLGGLANAPQGPPPTVVRVALLGGAAGLLFTAGRALAMSLLVTGDDVTIKNLLRTVRLGRDDVLAVVMPDDVSIAARPFLRTKAGGEVRLSAISRVKNRAWGDELAVREQVARLASALGVELIEDQDAATRHRCG